ncbi:hypothetical protein HanPI659440_Chr06g0236661 [Helianthus annuus]|nr:hypothetical protein HanPI659440_Chr06g0236661 [Helianthus annuus]
MARNARRGKHYQVSGSIKQKEEGDPHSQNPSNSLISQIEGSNQVKIENRA